MLAVIVSPLGLPQLLAKLLKFNEYSKEYFVLYETYCLYGSVSWNGILFVASSHLLLSVT